MTFEGMNPHGYALALLFVTESETLPLPVRAAWLAFLRPCEPGPQAVREAAISAHEAGQMRGGHLTPEGVRVALEALRGAALPPALYTRPMRGRR